MSRKTNLNIYPEQDCHMSADVRSRWWWGGNHILTMFRKCLQKYNPIGQLEEDTKVQLRKGSGACLVPVVSRLLQRQISVKWDEDTQLIMMRTAADSTQKKKVTGFTQEAKTSWISKE